MSVADSAEPEHVPDDPAELGKRSWWNVAKRSGKEFHEDKLTDWAAALTYYGVLSVFPALIVLVSLLGLIGDSVTDPLLDNLGSVAPGPAQDILTSAIENLQNSQGASGVFFVIGLVGAVWAASGYVGAFMRPRTRSTTSRRGGPYGERCAHGWASPCCLWSSPPSARSA